jgi:hypothetical protein
MRITGKKKHPFANRTLAISQTFSKIFRPRFFYYTKIHQTASGQSKAFFFLRRVMHSWSPSYETHSHPRCEIRSYRGCRTSILFVCPSKGSRKPWQPPPNEHYPLNGRFRQGVFRARDRVATSQRTPPVREGRTSSGNNADRYDTR